MPEPEEEKKVSNNDLRDSQFAGGFINAENVSAERIGGDIYNVSTQEDNHGITISKDAISSAIISGNGNKVTIYQYQLERQVQSETISDPGEIGANPYKGLLAFQEEDSDRYFGRESQISKLWNLFRTLHENTTQPEAPLRKHRWRNDLQWG
jgi:hypothetical protein